MFEPKLTKCKGVEQLSYFS